MTKIEALRKIATRLRIHSLRMTTEAGSGHPTTCLSMAELIACLFFGVMQYNPKNPDDWENDEFVLSKGHAAPILWAAYAEAGIIPMDELKNLRKITSDLEGHPTPRMKWVKTATGSLGQGLAIGTGMALAMKLAKSKRRVFVLMGDGECAEGAVWEAANIAAHYKLDNLFAIVDINRLGQSEETMHGHNIKVYERKFEAFNWETISVDGHNVEEILSAMKTGGEKGRPKAILAKTLKGKGVSFIENKNGWHGKPLKQEGLEEALKEIGPMPEIDARKYVKVPKGKTKPVIKKRFDFKRNTYNKNTATRRAFGNALLSLGKINSAVVAIDGDVKNSTYNDAFFEAFPERSFQNYIAEQGMVGMGIGLAAKGYIPFIATFAAFLSRAHDQIRMAAYSFSNIKLVGSHVGVSIGADGPSQMGLEDMAIFSPIPECVILYPCDACSTEGCLESLARHRGMTYLRTTRPATPVVYGPQEKFPIGSWKTLRKSSRDMAVVIAAGITVHEALKAYQELRKDGIHVRVIDAYSIQPVDKRVLNSSVKDASKKVVVVEDHFQGGGLGDAVRRSLKTMAEVIHLCIRELPRSGKPEELLDKYGISAKHIEKAVKRLARGNR